MALLSAVLCSQASPRVFRHSVLMLEPHLLWQHEWPLSRASGCGMGTCRYFCQTTIAAVCRQVTLVTTQMPPPGPSSDISWMSQPIMSPLIRNKRGWDFPGGPVVKNPSCNAGDAGSTPGLGTKIPHATKQLSPRATARESMHCNERSHDAAKTWFSQINKYMNNCLVIL